MGFNPPPGWPVPRGWEPPPEWIPDPAWPPAPAGWQFWSEETTPPERIEAPDPPQQSAPSQQPGAPTAQQSWARRPERQWAPSPQQPLRRGLAPIAVITVAVLVVTALVGGAYLAVKHWTGSGDNGDPVAGQLRGTFPEKPSTGWRLNADTVFDRASFVRPDPTSYQYQRPGFIDLGDTLITAAVLPNTDRGATLVAIDAESGDIKWTADAGFHPACASAVVDGLLPCASDEPSWGPTPSPHSVYFVRMSDGRIDHQLPVADYTTAVEVHGSAVYTMGYDHTRNSRFITRGTVEDLTATWDVSYGVSDRAEGCGGSGDSRYDGVVDDVVYSGIDAGMVVADATDGKRLLPGQVANLSMFPGQGFSARSCGGTNPGVVNTVVVDDQGATLRTVTGRAPAADPRLVSPTGDLPYIIDRTAYDFESGRELWTAAGGDAVAELHTIIGDTVLGGGRHQGPLGAFDLATGEHLWTSEISAPEIDLSDGQRIMIVTNDGLVAIDLATGEQVWALSGIERWRSVAPAGSGFAHATNDFIAYYPPTGGPSVAPGRASDTQSKDNNASGELITKCGRTPEMRPVEYRAEGGALLVTMEVKARCPGGDIVSTDRLRVTIRDHLGRICSAVFDFSHDPLILGGEGSEPTSLELTFADGTFSRHPNTLGDRSGQPSGSPGIVTEASASGTEVVDCEDEGTSSGPQSATDPGARAQPKSVPSSTGGGAPDCGSDVDTLAALRAQVDADRTFVQSNLADRWVAQLSAKQPGLVAADVDGRVLTWTPCDILQQHLRMRGQYPEVRLVWSDEWRTFDLAGWWVTIAGVTFPDPDAANRWCDARAIPVDECFAKVVSNSGDSRGTTKYRR